MKVIALATLTVSALLGVVGCDDSTPQAKIQPLSPEEAAQVLTDFGVNAPGTYSLVEMKRTTPPGVGSPSYSGAFESASKPAPVIFQGKALDGLPVDCKSVKPGLVTIWGKYGFTCDMHDLRFTEVKPQRPPASTLDLLTGVLPSGKTRLYVYSSGN